uniref:Uncharacterized protein n=1 Tax=Riptortus pedestris TaxID=329032 RepID=R4WD61_RIPPE|nr:unknown secreted protein [Riptortus pedestris]
MGFLSWLIVTAVGGAVAFLCPPLIGGVAWMFGFGASGVAAGSIFSILQAGAMASPTP